LYTFKLNNHISDIEKELDAAVGLPEDLHDTEEIKRE
jgi:hypothetical protein